MSISGKVLISNHLLAVAVLPPSDVLILLVHVSLLKSDDGCLQERQNAVKESQQQQHKGGCEFTWPIDLHSISKFHQLSVFFED